MSTPATEKEKVLRRSGFMSNRPAVLLWVSVKIRNGPDKRGFSFGVPVPLFLLFQWTDMAEDALTLARLFPGARRSLDRVPVFDILPALRRFAEELCRTGPEELADVDVEEPGGRRVRVRCFLR